MEKPDEVGTVVMRTSTVTRKTKETDITVFVDLDGRGAFDGDTSVPMLNHMLDQVAKHGILDLTVNASGDNEHHIVEDVAIVMGLALGEALGKRDGIRRFSNAKVPMDDALVEVTLDLVDRPYFDAGQMLTAEVGGVMPAHFLRTLAIEGRFTMHLEMIRGYDPHHAIEATFKALGLALRGAAEHDPRRIGSPSTKGAERLTVECSNCNGTGIDPQTQKKCEICSSEE